MIVRESDGILALSNVFNECKDYDLKSVITTLLVFLSLNKNSNTTTENLMKDINNQILQLLKDGKLFPTHLDIINKWLGGAKKFNLLYKAVNDGFTGSAFHAKCDNKGPTVTIITSTEGYVFGGYSAVAWVSRDDFIADNSNQSFLFSLKNPRNEPPKKFRLIKPGWAIHGSSYDQPAFGAGRDIGCCENSNKNNKSHFNFGYSYDPTPFTYGKDAKTAFTGACNFSSKDIEVYQVL